MQLHGSLTSKSMLAVDQACTLLGCQGRGVGGGVSGLELEISSCGGVGVQNVQFF